MRLVFLNACRTEDLGNELRRAGVPFVICWRTLVDDTPARQFGTAFYDACAEGSDEREAFELAKDAILCQLTRASVPVLLEQSVPKYELRGPGEPARNEFIHPPPLAAGVPLLICEDGTTIAAESPIV